jgi:hypothetical protein
MNAIVEPATATHSDARGSGDGGGHGVAGGGGVAASSIHER